MRALNGSAYAFCSVLCNLRRGQRTEANEQGQPMTRQSSGCGVVRLPRARSHRGTEVVFSRGGYVATGYHRAPSANGVHGPDRFRQRWKEGQSGKRVASPGARAERRQQTVFTDTAGCVEASLKQQTAAHRDARLERRQPTVSTVMANLASRAAKPEEANRLRRRGGRGAGRHQRRCRRWRSLGIYACSAAGRVGS